MASEAFNDTNWAGYDTITSDNTKVDEAVSDIYFDLSDASSGFWNAIEQADGGDIRVASSDGTTAYSFEIEGFNNNDDGTGSGALFFDCSDDMATGSDISWRLYAGNSGASMPSAVATLGSENVWDAGYKGVYHLEDANDSTSNSNDGTFNGNLPTQISGKLGKAQEFDGTGDYVSRNGILSTESNWSVSAWAKADNNDSNAIASECSINSGDQTAGWTIYHYNGNIHVASANGSSVSQAGTSSGRIGTTNFHHIVVTKSGSTIKIYVDNNEDYSATYNIGNNTQSFKIGDGSRFSGGVWGYADMEWDGKIDDARALNQTVSANWVSTHYNNQNSPSTFWTVTTEGWGFLLDTGSFALTGVSGGLLRAEILNMTTGSFSFTGVATGLIMAFKVVLNVASFILTGIASLFPFGWHYQDLSATGWTNESPNSASFTNTNSNTTSWTNKSKN